MFDFLTRYKHMAEFVIFVAVAAVMMYGVHLILKYERTMGYDQATAECNTKELIAEVAARKKEAAYIKQLQEADRNGIIRDQQIEVLSKSVASVDNRLRDTTSALRNRLPTASIDALRKTADAALAVFGDCKEQYAEMGRNAQGHASDVMKLQDDWPK